MKKSWMFVLLVVLQTAIYGAANVVMKVAYSDIPPLWCTALRFGIAFFVFMLLFGVNFSLYYLLLLRQFKSVFKNEELRLYAGIAVGAIVLITIDISRMYGSVREALHHAAFQVSSIMTTTGFASVDFEQWPAFSKAVLLALMFVGACAGSTAGGLKVSRVLLLLKSIRRTVRRASGWTAASSMRPS